MGKRDMIHTVWVTGQPALQVSASAVPPPLPWHRQKNDIDHYSEVHCSGYSSVINLSSNTKHILAVYIIQIVISLSRRHALYH